jgi:hypothetical protein
MKASGGKLLRSLEIVDEMIRTFEIVEIPAGLNVEFLNQTMKSGDNKLFTWSNILGEDNVDKLLFLFIRESGIYHSMCFDMPWLPIVIVFPLEFP